MDICGHMDHIVYSSGKSEFGDLGKVEGPTVPPKSLFGDSEARL